MFYYQASKDAKQLHNIGVSDRIEATEESINNDNNSRDDNRGVIIELHDDTDRAAERGQDSRRPEDLAEQRRYEQQAAHSLAILALKRVDHGHVALASHASSEQDAAKYQAQCVTNRSLTPHQASRVDRFGRAVYETASDPCRF